MRLSTQWWLDSTQLCTYGTSHPAFHPVDDAGQVKKKHTHTHTLTQTLPGFLKEMPLPTVKRRKGQSKRSSSATGGKAKAAGTGVKRRKRRVRRTKSRRKLVRLKIKQL